MVSCAAEFASREGLDTFTFCFSETPGRAVVVVDASREAELEALCATHGVPTALIGTCGEGSDVRIDGVVASLADLRAAHEGTFPALFG